MKICFIAPSAYQLFNPSVKSQFGGAEVQLSLIAKEMAKSSELDVHFIVGDYGQEEKEEYENVSVWKSVNYQKGAFTNMTAFLRQFKRVNADVYVQRALSPFSVVIGLICRFFGKKFVYMIAHDSEIDGTHVTFTNLLTKRLGEWCFRIGHIVIAQNSYQKATLFKRKKVESSVLLSGYPLIDVILPPEERKFHLWVGRADPMKQPFLFLQLAKQIPESQFVMICPPNINRNASEYISLQEEAASIPNLEFIPFVHFPKINPYFQQAITLVNTSGSEGFPNTYIQASLNSTPIMSLGVNPNQFLTEYNCGKTFKDDLSLMAQFIQELDQTSDSYRQMSENAFRYAKKNHDISHITSQILELIKD